MSTILVFALQADSRDQICEYLQRSGYQVQAASSEAETRKLLEKFGYDVLLADVEESRAAVRALLQLHERCRPQTELVLLIRQGLLGRIPELAAEAIFEVVEKPYSMERLRLNIERALEARRLRYEAQSLRHERHLIHQTDGFIAVSRATKGVLKLANKVAQSDSTALLTGETGTGKELVAGAIHYGSARAAGPFVKVNCAALPTQLLESELFGHEKGAFTGADRPRTGRFEHANTGTIFFDEVGDMSLETQAKVLRVVQEREFQRLGSSRTIRTDVRLIAATNKSLPDLVAAGEFREDLYYRLNVITVEIPALRDRREDIMPLVDFFSRKLSGDLKRKRKEFSPGAIEAMLAYSWPGNIRELQNVVERGVLLSDGALITVHDLGLPEAAGAPEQASYAGGIELPRGGADLKEVERSLVLQALERSDWVQKDAALLLGLSTRVLNHKIRRFGIRHPRWRRNA